MSAEQKPMDAADVRRAGGLLDLADAKEIRPARTSRANGHATNDNGHGTDWEDPMPLMAASERPVFPVDTLPPWLGEWASAVSTSVQVTVDMPALLGLAMVSIACARRMVVHVRGDHVVPVNIYVCAAADVSERKSPVFAAARAPIDSYERARRDAASAEAGHAEDAVAIARKKLQKAIDAASKTDDTHEAMALEGDVRDARNELEKAERARRPALRLTAADVTQEELARLMCEQGGRMAVLDPEGVGPISIMLGRYAKATNVDIYLKSYNGEQLSVDRVARADGTSRSFTVVRPALTVALTIQPRVFDKLGEDKDTRGLGLLARFLWCVPVSLVGRRREDAPGVPSHIKQVYETNLHELLALELGEDDRPYELRLSVAADGAHQHFERELEPQLGPGGRLRHVRDYAGKLAGLVARLAALLHCAKHRTRPWDTPISVQSMANAITIARWSLTHAEYTLERIGSKGGSAELAQQILEFARARQLAVLDPRTLQRELRPRCNRRDLDAPLRQLCEHGWLRRETAAARGAVEKGMVRWRVHPKALSQDLVQ